jgi:hypothetical protein
MCKGYYEVQFEVNTEKPVFLSELRHDAIFPVQLRFDRQSRLRAEYAADRGHAP